MTIVVFWLVYWIKRNKEGKKGIFFSDKVEENKLKIQGKKGIKQFKWEFSRSIKQNHVKLNEINKHWGNYNGFDYHPHGPPEGPTGQKQPGTVE